MRARITSRAHTVIGDAEAAKRWLQSPKRRFQGCSPNEMLATERGARQVDEMLTQIDDGMFA